MGQQKTAKPGSYQRTGQSQSGKLENNVVVIAVLIGYNTRLVRP
jgi:hypothetical protein